MKVFSLCLLVSLANYISWSAEIPIPEEAGLGRYIVGPFANAAYPDPSRAKGHTYHGVLYSAATNYSDSTVCMFIPNGFRATDKVDFVVHFHGWRHSVAMTLPEYHLPEQFVASGRNAILIVPQGPYMSPDSGGGKLETTNGFKRFMDEAMTKLKADGVCSNDAQIGDIILSSHSGGYETAASILARGGLTAQIRDVWLFDSLYGYDDTFLNWAAGAQSRFLVIYTDHGGTKDDAESVIATLRQQGKALIATNDVNVTAADLAAAHYAVMHSDLPHDDVPMKRNAFQEFLETSFLPAIK